MMSDDREEVQLQTGADTVEVHTSILVVVGFLLIVIGSVLGLLITVLGVSNHVLWSITVLWAVAGGLLICYDAYLFPEGHHPERKR
jgi:hypothetical protein